MNFPARYPGKCANCGERYPADTEITKAEGGYTHTDCTDAEPQPPIEGPACSVCWLRHPEGECDR